MLGIWTEDDKRRAAPTPRPKLRQIVFINSAAAFLGLPGSIAYTRKYPIKTVQCSSIATKTYLLSGQVCCTRVSGHSPDGSITIQLPEFHILDPLCLPSRLYLTWVHVGAEH